MNDLISRQAAIDLFDVPDADGMFTSCGYAMRELRKLPTSQPEIIRCKDCKYSEHWYRDKSRCFLWHEEGIDVFEDGYCNYAGRKDDE